MSDRPHYPWREGDALFADELNMAIATAGGGTTNFIRVNSVAPDETLSIDQSGAEGHATNWLWSNVLLTGTATTPDPYADGSFGVNKFLVSDVAVFPGGTANALYAQSIQGGNTDATNTASRQAIHARMIVHGQNGPTPTLGQPFVNADFVGQLSIVYATASQGGLGGWPGGATPPGNGYFRGSLFGGNDNVWLASGASNYWLMVGREIDVTINSGSSVYQRIGALLSSGVSASQAAADDCGLMFVSGDTSAHAHKVGIQFGGSTTAGLFSDALIKVVPRTYPAPATPAYVTGLDFTAATFSGNALATPGFKVDGNGRVTVHLDNAANDAAAATAGTGIDQLYRNGNAILVRLV